MNKPELQERLINFAASIVEIVNELPNTKAGNHLAGQLVRSGTARRNMTNERKAQINRKSSRFIGINPCS